jgi:uncharacterized membrane protein YdjX (TVP38/TMEM64 family)
MSATLIVLQLMTFSPAPRPMPLNRVSPSRALPPLCLNAQTERQIEQELDVWKLREGMIRGLFGVLVNWKEDGREEAARKDTTESPSKAAFVASATAVILGTIVLRFGGRAALVSILGLDMMADLGIDDKVDDFVAYANSLGPLTVLGFLGAWIVAKVFLLDFISIGLALSSGVLFGGVIQGALLSSACATAGSLVGFTLSRGLLQERVEGAIAKQPIARGLAKVVNDDGFKTVFVLRLAPIIPALPLGAYPYIYGASNLTALPFAAGTFLGGLKPYLIDSYVGCFSKQLLDGNSMDSAKDTILLVGIGVLVLIGVFATELAGDSWERVQEEVAADERRRREAGEELGGAGARDGAWVLGPFNSTAAQSWALERVPSSTKDEIAQVWDTLNAFATYQWEPAAARALAARRKKKEAPPLPGADSDNPIERLLASLATPTTAASDAAGASGGSRSSSGSGSGSSSGGGGGSSSGGISEGKTKVGATVTGARGVATLIYGEDDQATPQDLAERERCAAWSVEGGIGRVALTSLLFTFAMFNAAKLQWETYPETVAGLDALLSPPPPPPPLPPPPPPKRVIGLF